MWWAIPGLLASCIAGTVHGTGAPRNPCVKGGELYHVYPADPHKYVQCNEWGRAFLRECPPDHIWHNEHKTCVDAAGEGATSGGNGLPINGPDQQQNNGHSMPDKMGVTNSPQEEPMGPRNGHSSMGANGNQHGGPRTGNGQRPGSHKPWNMKMYMKMMNSMGYHGGKSIHVSKSWVPPPQPPPAAPSAAASEEADTGEDTDPLNPCLHSDLQFIPHPADPTKYFECVGGLAEERRCPANSIWRQETTRCQAIPQPRPAPTKPPQPKPKQNPCMGTRQKYWPYRPDPRKYVECRGWYDLPLLRSCDPGKVWVQQEMKCVPLTLPTPKPSRPRPRPRPQPTARPTRRPTRPPPTTTTTPLPPTSTQSTVDFCLNSDSFYHPYAPDSTKFIQCDEYGNMYIRYCGPKKRWEDGLKTCIGDNNVTVTTAAPDAGPASSSSASSSSSSSTSSSSSSSSTGSSSSFSSSADILENILRNNPCGLDEVYHPLTQECVDMSELVSLADEVIQILCPDGFQWNPDQAMCEEYKDPETRMFLDYNRGPNCEEGYLWDTQLGACVQAIKVKDMITAFGNIKDADRYFMARYPNLKASSFGGENAVSDGDTGGPGGGDTGGPGGGDQEVPIPEYTGDNPCGSLDSFYYPFPGDPRYFVQCDLAGAMYVQPCSVGLYWNQGLLTCTAYNAQDEAAEEDGEGGEEGDAGDMSAGPTTEDGVVIVDASSLARNPCLDSTEVYHAYPYDEHLFVMCTGQMPFIMACPERLVWNNKTNTCDWPDLEPEEDEEEEEGDY